MGTLKIGELFAYRRPYSPDPDRIDELRNYFAVTDLPGMPKALLESGISPIGVSKADGSTPAILISSSPHIAGSEKSPWDDQFDSDNGLVRYFGDNKSNRRAAHEAPGNAQLLRQFELHKSTNEVDRQRAIPILLFQRVPLPGRVKGTLKFHGLGIITKAELIAQFQADIGYFTNFVFEFQVLNLLKEADDFDWTWINERRLKGTSDQTALLAPWSWRRWVRDGENVLPSLRRVVLKRKTMTKAEQIPPIGSKGRGLLEEIHKYYSATKKKHHFELLASLVAEQILSSGGDRYLNGWVTQASGDGGIDFVGRLEVGTGSTNVKLVVLGQAKCEAIESATSGRDIARTVSRLRRGWIGAYVTTGYFSKQAQIEIVNDEFPLLLVNGNDVAREVQTMFEGTRFTKISEFLDYIHDSITVEVLKKRPEEILDL